MEVVENLKRFPNQITFFRLLVLPLLYYFAIAQRPILFSILFVMAGISDTLDGIVARKYKLCSSFGSNLDQTADDAILLSVVVFMFLLKPSVYFKQVYLIFGLTILYIINRVIINIKFGWKVRLHTYAGKIYERLNYIIVPVILFIENYSPFFYILMFFGYYTVIEEILIYITNKRLNINMKSIFIKPRDK